MGRTAPEKAKHVMLALMAGFRVGINGTSAIEWYNQEDVLSTLKRTTGRGIDKSELRKILENLSKKGFIEKREAEIKTQSKGEYKIAEAGTNYLIELDKITKGMSDINK